VPAIRAALKAGVLNGIVTDESSARAILSGA
jgi:DNA-binding transcriptional regulator LsrR (DeoR family)